LLRCGLLGASGLKRFRHVIDAFDHDDALTVLRNLRTAIGDTPGVRLLNIDMVLTDRTAAVDPDHGKYLLDMHVLMLLGSQERSRSEWQTLVTAAGFKLVAFHPTRGLVHVLEAVPV
jgi:hypothetical protein